MPNVQSRSHPKKDYNYASISYAKEIMNSFQLNCLSVNCQSFKSNYLHITNIIDSLRQPAILSFSEIWNPPDCLTNLTDYHPPILKKRRNRKGGGVALYVRSDIKIKKIDLLNHLHLSCLEVVSATIEIDGKSFTYVSCYRAPNKNQINTLEEIEELLEYFSTYNHQIYLLGDMNICTDKNSIKNSKMSKRYLEILETFSLKQIIGIPTRVTSHSESIIDHVISNCRLESKVMVLDNNFSDHQPILLSCLENTKENYETREKETSTYLNYKKSTLALESLDWDQIFADFNMKTSDECTIEFIKIIQSCLVYEKRVNKSKIPIKPWMTNDLIKLRNKQLKKRRIFMKCRSEENETKFKNVQKEYKKALKKSKSNYYYSEISKTEGDSKKIWKLINENLNRNKKKSDPKKIKVMKDGNLITDDFEVANCFNEFYINFGPELAKTLPTAKTSIEDLLKKVPKPNDTFSFIEMTKEEIDDILLSLKPKTSSSADGISNKLLLAIKTHISQILTLIINKSFSEGLFPNELKIAKVIPLFKADSELECGNYRPISQLSPISKCIEKAAQKQILHYTNSNHIIPDLQFGFRALHSTLHPLLAVTEYIQRKLRKNEHVFLCAIDLKKCFDLVQTVKILPKKLKHLNFDDNSINWITSFFANRRQFAHVNNTNSTTEKLHDISLTQGSSMGPPTFSIFVFDLPLHTNFTTFLFADDTTLLLSNPSLHQLILDANKELAKIENYMVANELFLNYKKTVYTLYHPPGIDITAPPPKAKIGDHPIEMVHSIKFLGLTLEHNQSFSIHYDNVTKKMRKGIAGLSLVRFDFPITTKMMIYNSLVKSAYEYANPIWILSLTKSQINYILKLQKRALRCIFRIRKKCHSNYLFKKSGIIRFDHFFTKFVIDLLFGYFKNALPNKIMELLNHFDFPRALRNSNKHCFNIPLHLAKGDLFFEIMSHWNKLPNYLKIQIFDEAKREKPSKLIIKKLTKKYIESLYEECNLKPCALCVQTKLLILKEQKNDD